MAHYFPWRVVHLHLAPSSAFSRGDSDETLAHALRDLPNASLPSHSPVWLGGDGIRDLYRILLHMPTRGASLPHSLLPRCLPAVRVA